MMFVNMDLAQFYQPPNMAGLCSDGRPAASNFRLSTARAKDNNPGAFEPSKKSSRTFQNHDLIEILNMTGLPPEELLNSLDVPAPDLGRTQRDTEGTVLY